MNPLRTFEELWRNREYLRAYDGGEYKVWEVETNKARVRGHLLTEHRHWRQKLENMLVLAEPHQKVKVHFI